jgi:hypothetical protein
MRYQKKKELLQELLEKADMDIYSEMFKEKAVIPLPFTCQQQFFNDLMENKQGDQLACLEIDKAHQEDPQEYDYILNLNLKSAATPRQVQLGKTKKVFKKKFKPFGGDDDGMDRVGS